MNENENASQLKDLIANMHIINPGIYQINFQGENAPLEGILEIPANCRQDCIALLGHPHSLHGGSINNKVVTTTARAFKDLNVASIRFNFRGVFGSKGTYANGIGEANDMIVLYDLCKQVRNNLHFFFAGFSFGSYVVYRASLERQARLLILIAPPIEHFHFAPTPSDPNWVVIFGEDDEIVSVQALKNFISLLPKTVESYEMPSSSHFFHGKLLQLRSLLVQVISKKCPQKNL